MKKLNLNLKQKLIIIFLVAGVIPMTILGIFTVNFASSTVKEEVLNKLVTVREIKSSSIKSYFDTIRDQVLTFSDNVATVEAMNGFSNSFETVLKEDEIQESQIPDFKEKLITYYRDEFEVKFKNENKKTSSYLDLVNGLTNKEIYLQYKYIKENKNPLGSKETLDFAPGKASYHALHKKFHPGTRNFLNKFGYYDIFLINNVTGNIVYSVFKELDYGTSLLTGPYANTNFATAFKKAKSLKKGEFILVDFEKYLPSYDSPASFIASPVFDGKKQIGVAIFQMPIDRINAVMTDRSGMGKTEETYIVGPNGRLRSDSAIHADVFNVVNSFKNTSAAGIKTDNAKKSLNESSSNISNNYVGEEVISAYAPLEILGNKWGVIAEITTNEAYAALGEMIQMITWIVLACILFVIFLSMFSCKVVIDIIQVVTSKLSKSAGDVLKISANVSAQSDKLSEVTESQASSLQQTVSSITEIRSMVEKNTDNAKNSISVSNNSTKVTEKGKVIVGSLENSIREIASSNESLLNSVEENNNNLEKVIKVISEIEDKTKVINDIVFQTKLLSFNASVEAARAGEEGKGFAVVAEEVGSLASMSGEAASEIAQMLDSSINEVKHLIEESKASVSKIVSLTKEKVDTGISVTADCSSSFEEINSNVKSLDAMIKEISHASTEQLSGVNEVSSAMESLDQSTHINKVMANETAEMSKNLAKSSDVLFNTIDELKSLLGDKKNQKST